MEIAFTSVNHMKCFTLKLLVFREPCSKADSDGLQAYEPLLCLAATDPCLQLIFPRADGRTADVLVVGSSGSDSAATWA